MEKEILLGNTIFSENKEKVTGGFTDIDGESFYKIENQHLMEPFFMTIVSSTDHWMFISSNGGLSAGRKNPDSALFPYYTVDKIQDTAEISGSKSLFLVTRNDKTSLWEPFSDRYNGVYKIKRNLYKSIYGNKLVFEEINEDLGLTFSYQWMNSEKFGFIKKSLLKNNLNSPCALSVLDGIQNILPAGIDRQLQLGFSNLVDAYKKNELVDSTIGLFMLSSVIVDKAEPSEALKTTVVWSEGIENPKILLSAKQLNNFRKGISIETESDVRATKGAYFINSEINLVANQERSWHIVAELNKDAGYIASLKNFIKKEKNLAQQLQEDVNKCTQDLIKIVASSDGLQLSQDKLSTNRHMSNVLFNVMRGGIFGDNYEVSIVDLLEFFKGANALVYEKNKDFISALGTTIAYPTLLEQLGNIQDDQLIRLCYEYLPLSFSRRHGDPSRPWNLFSIETTKEDGSKNLNYQGNWRDIFQNWETLSLSFPSYVESMIGKFVNASTADGYNPYRITRNGIDWESPDPHDPWANIGYWGDHQIIYLQKFLEVSKKYHPGALNAMLTSNVFAYANVPYRIKSYQDLLKNPFDTIEFDFEAEKTALANVKKMGSDGKLVLDKNGAVLQVNFTEKLLVMVLAKLSNFVPEAGIWLNTQRPEWNDANNALVGNGVSMVTLYQMRRLLHFCSDLFKEVTSNQITVSEEVAEFFNAIFTTFLKFEETLAGKISDQKRKSIMDDLGISGSNYRAKIYNGFSENKKEVTTSQVSEFIALTLKYIDHTIHANKRADNLYHSYNLIAIKNDSVSIRYLYEMLEGQVAALSAGFMDTNEVIEVLDALKNSAMYRKDQYSYMLYPDRQLARFMEKNCIPAELVESSKLLIQLIAENNTKIAYKDVDGNYHFNANFRNAADLNNGLNALQSSNNWVEEERELVLNIFEKVFDHQSFTGRSGTFYGFEGLGCIYWHMVSKLLLAINENYFVAVNNNANQEQIGRLVQHYYDVRAGIGFNKSPELFGAFPTDAYSHTPGGGGAKQPGMTGQVKEDIISRFGELGIFVENGKILFKPALLRKSEFLISSEKFVYFTINNEITAIELESNSIGFTFCQVPFVYKSSNENRIEIIDTNNKKTQISSLEIDAISSNEIFNRTGLINQVVVYLTPRLE